MVPGAAPQEAETLCWIHLGPRTIYSQGPRLLTCDIPLRPPHPGARPVQSTLLSLLPFLFFLHPRGRVVFFPPPCGADTHLVRRSLDDKEELALECQSPPTWGPVHSSLPLIRLWAALWPPSLYIQVPVSCPGCSAGSREIGIRFGRRKEVEPRMSRGDSQRRDPAETSPTTRAPKEAGQIQRSQGAE